MIEGEIGAVKSIAFSPTISFFRSDAKFIYPKNNVNSGENVMREMGKCIHCGNSFQINPYTKGKYCSYKCYWDSMRKYPTTICAICSKEFINQKGKRRCCSRKCRNEFFRRRNTKTCIVCRKEFTNLHKEQKTCSWKCGIEYKKKRVDNTCLFCGKVFQTVPSERRNHCSQLCGVKANSPWSKEQEQLLVENYKKMKYPKLEKLLGKKQKAIDHKVRKKYPELKKKKPSTTVRCANCSKEFKRCYSLLSSGKWGDFCSRRCRGEFITKNITGERHHAWRGGYFPYFGRNWRLMKKTMRSNMELRCSICGTDERQLSTKLHIHHIVPRRNFIRVEDSNRLDNLVLLCNKHHKEVEDGKIKLRDMLEVRKTKTFSKLFVGDVPSLPTSISVGDKSVGSCNQESYTYIGK